MSRPTQAQMDNFAQAVGKVTADLQRQIDMLAVGIDMLFRRIDPNYPPTKPTEGEPNANQ